MKKITFFVGLIVILTGCETTQGLNVIGRTLHDPNYNSNQYQRYQPPEYKPMYRPTNTQCRTWGNQLNCRTY